MRAGADESYSVECAAKHLPRGLCVCMCACKLQHLIHRDLYCGLPANICTGSIYIHMVCASLQVSLL